MGEKRKIESALISVYNKHRLEEILQRLDAGGVKIFSTGGTYDFIAKCGFNAVTVESLTGYPPVFGGRVKTLHPLIFGGILYRRNIDEDIRQANQYNIPSFDLVIVDLYPFEETLASGAGEEEIIEKIDIGGISLIRAAAKNYQDVLVVSSASQYDEFIRLWDEKNGYSETEDRKRFATLAFSVTSHYDTAIFNYFNTEQRIPAFRQSVNGGMILRYGENPHQKGIYYGSPDEVFAQLHGKEISYNNLVDIEAALNLIDEFDSTAFAVIKHTNACGAALDDCTVNAFKRALAGDPVSAFGGILVTNRLVDEETATEADKIFFEIIIAPGYGDNALEILKRKKNRIILQRKNTVFPSFQYRSLLNGVIWQERDMKKETLRDLKVVAGQTPDDRQIEDLLFANILVKHTKSNAIVLAKNRQLIGSGTGQTSRVDALKQAISKAREFNFDLQGAVMASDAFFPFADCVEIAHKAGISAVIQPGGSVRDQDSIDYCNACGMTMVFTGFRHFKH